MAALLCGACGRSIRHDPSSTSTGAGGTGTTSATGGTGGTSGATGNGGSSISVSPESATEFVHTVVGRVEESSCLSSLVATPSGVVVAGTRHDQPFSASGERDAPEGSWWQESLLPETRGRSLVFGDDSGYVLASSAAYPSTTAPAELDIELHHPDGSTTFFEWPAPGDPVAGIGSPSGFTVALSDANQLALLRSDGDGFSLIPVEAEPCVAPSSVALGHFGDDVVVAYFCTRFVRTDTAEAQHLIVARLNAVSGEVEKTTLDVGLGETVNGQVESGTPAATWVDGEFLFAHGTSGSSAQMALTRVGDDLIPHTQVVTGTPVTSVNAGDYDPIYSVVQVGDRIALARSACNGHEDDGPTGSVSVCNVSPSTLEASCYDVEAPCSGAKLVANGAGVTLLGCPRGGAAALVPLELTAPPTPGAAQFPAGYTDFTPLSVIASGDGSSALFAVSAAELTTGYDRRVARVDLTWPALCSYGPGAACSPTQSFALTDVVTATHIRGGYYSSSFGLEAQPAGFPIGLTSVRRDGIQSVPTLSRLERSGSVRWTEPLINTSMVFFNEGESYRLMGGEFTTTTLAEYVASAGGVTEEPGLAVGSAASPPGVAQCDGRYFVHGTTITTSVTELATPAIYTVTPGDSAPRFLFNPGVAAATSGRPPPALGCAGARIFLLEGLVLHRYLENGEREPDITVGTPLTPGTSNGTLVTRLETHRDYALVLSGNMLANELGALFLYPDGTTRAFALPVAEGVLPISSLMSAPDLVNGWLTVLYQSVNREGPHAQWGNSVSSAYRLPL